MLIYDLKTLSFGQLPFAFTFSEFLEGEKAPNVDKLTSTNKNV